MQSSTSTWVKRIAIILGILALLGTIGLAVKGLLAGGKAEKRNVTKITLKDLPPPPPPPPPPPKDEPKEVKEQPKEVKVEQPKPVETPPAEQLKMEGAAGDGPSPFAAGAVKDEYKGGEVKTIGKPDSSKFSWYAGLLRSRIEEALGKDKRLTEGQYKLQVNVWIRADGSIDKVELLHSDSSPETEVLIKEALSELPALREPLPADMPQPVRLRISARKMG